VPKLPPLSGIGRAMPGEWEPTFFDTYGVSAAKVAPSTMALLSRKHLDELALWRCQVTLVSAGCLQR